MATQQLMAILLRVGDTILWLSPEAEDLVPVELQVKKIHYGDPIAGRIRVEVNQGPPLRLSAKAPIGIVVQLKS